MTASFPPIRREPRVDYRPLKPEDGKKAVELVREALLFFRAGEPIIYPDHVDVPVFYLNFAIDRVRYDENWGQYRGERHRRGLSGQPHSPQDSKGWGGAPPPPFRPVLLGKLLDVEYLFLRLLRHDYEVAGTVLRDLDC